MVLSPLVHAMLPELMLAAIGVLVLLVDVFFCRGRPIAWRMRVLGLGVTGLLLATAALLGVWTAQGWGGELFADAERLVVIDRYALAVKAFLVLLAALTTVLAASYPTSRHVGEQLALLVFATLAACLLVSTENLIGFFVAFELLSVCLYVLVGLHKGVLRSAEGALKFFAFGALSSAFLLFGLSYLVGIGGITFGTLGAKLAATAGSPSHSLALVGMVFVLLGIGFKLALAPFHGWAPDAYEGAPTPSTAFLASVSKVASGVVALKFVVAVAFGSMRGSARLDVLPSVGKSALHLDEGVAPVVAGLAALSMLWGSIAATRQSNTKRLLAYSGVAHSGYFLLGMVGSSLAGVVASSFYLVVYALAALGALGVIAALTPALGGDDLEELDGLVQRKPAMAALLLVFVLSLAGIPPLAGFTGKLSLFAAALSADRAHLGTLWLVVIALIASAVSVYYSLGVLRRVFVSAPRAASPIEVPRATLLVLVLTAAAIVLLGIVPGPVLTALREVLVTSTWAGALK